MTTDDSPSPESPIHYEVDVDEGVIFETWRGAVSARDLESYWTILLADPVVMAIRRTLVDLRAATPTFTGEALDGLIKSVVLPRLQGARWATALLVSEPVQYGKSRQYHVFAERYSNDQIFHDRDEALQWLMQQRVEHDAT